MKITDVSIDRRRKELVILAGRRTFRYPLALLPVKGELIAAVADEEIGREGVECRFASGRTDTIHLDDIRAQLEIPIEKISAALTMMELKGMVRQVGGMNYVAVKEIQAEYRIAAEE